jgi:hypothetical protein
MYRFDRLAAVLAGVAVCAQPALASQDAQAAPLPPNSAPPAALAGPPIPDPAKLELPDLSRPTTADDAADFDKYFYFHRADTSYEQALADIRECDGYARGLSSPYGYQDVPYPYAGTLAGAAGGAIGNLMVAMIFGSAELRKARRTNMRRCMNYKGYDRFGLNKDVWQEFHFEEGLSSVKDEERQLKLAKQAKAASLVAPAGKVLGR